VFQFIGYRGVILKFMFPFVAEIFLLGKSNTMPLKVFVVEAVSFVFPTM